MRNIPPFFRFLVVGLSLLVSGYAHAEFECTSEVFYTWTQGETGGGGDAGAPMPPKDGAKEPAGAPPAPSNGDSAGGGPDKARKERFSVVQRKGGDEAAAKSLLGTEVQRQKIKASERCKKAHESVGECLTTKLSIKSSTLNSLSFSARAQAEKAIMDECQVEQGRCLPADSTPPECRELSAAQEGGASAKGGAAKGDSKADPKAKDTKAKDAKKK